MMIEKDILIIGAGITGLSLAFSLKKRGYSVALLEKEDRVGGQIRTHKENGFVFESGPNSGLYSEEVEELFAELPDCEPEFARKASEKRLIWKKGKFHPLPATLIGGICTPLFRFQDKLRVLGEPFRKRGKNPDESVGALAARRLGQSFVDYAVDPFISGIYAGDPYQLVTRHALPKLYNLEQDYGSFIRGGIAKGKEAVAKRREGAKVVKKGLFSVKGGIENLPLSLAKALGKDTIFLSLADCRINKSDENGIWHCSAHKEGAKLEFSAKAVITTVPAYALPELLPFVDAEDMSPIAGLKYAPVLQLALELKNRGNLFFDAFGGLIPSKEKEDLLGVLFSSSCFEGRAPEQGALFSFFMGGTKKKELLDLSDAEIKERVEELFHRILGFPLEQKPDEMHIFRHPRAIPQYDYSSDLRLQAIERIEEKYTGLHILGNLRDGVGLPHRIAQGLKFGKNFNFYRYR